MKNVAIIGAGLSGLTVAHQLKHIANITVFEKSRGVGGRMSTRRAEPYFFDHGAQFFTVRTEEFKSLIDPMITANIIAPWHARFVEFTDGVITERRLWGDKDNPHYVGVPGMNALLKELSRELVVHCDTRVHHIAKQSDQWLLYNEQQQLLGAFDWVISSLPAEQAAMLLPSSLAFYQQIKSVRMKSCFSLMLGFKYDLALDFDAALVRNADISWISVNHSKPGRKNDHTCLLIHSTNHWANQHIDDNRDDVLDYLCKQTSRLIGHDVSLANYQVVHGWRYANIDKQHSVKYFIDQEAGIGVCGDWLIQGRVEAAFISGHKLGNHLLGMLHHD